MRLRGPPSIAVVVLAYLALCACDDGSTTRGSLTWTWRYTGVGPDGAPITARGVLRTDRDPDGDGWYAIESIEGQRNGVRITGLYPAGQAIPGNVDPANGAPFAGDNLLRQSGAAHTPQLDENGLQFSLGDGTYSNVFFASFREPPTYLEFHSVPPFPEGVVPPNSELPGTFSAEVRVLGE
ncbi:MAG TPA: PEP-CTERM sorting domain-containing protein [Candidatus Binatia bacterium]